MCCCNLGSGLGNDISLNSNQDGLARGLTHFNGVLIKIYVEASKLRPSKRIFNVSFIDLLCSEANGGSLF